MSDLPNNRKVAARRGAYDMCRRLLTSPRFNTPQREVIEEQAYLVKEELEALGVSFADEPRRAA